MDYEAWKKATGNTISESALVFEELLGVADKELFKRLLAHALKSEIFLADPSRFGEYYLAALPLDKSGNFRDNIDTVVLALRENRKTEIISRAPAEAFFNELVLAELLFEVPKTKQSKIFDGKTPIFSDVSKQLEFYEDYVVPLMIEASRDIIKKVSLKYVSDRNTTTAPDLLDELFAPFLVTQLNLRNRYGVLSDDIPSFIRDFSPMARSLIENNSKHAAPFSSAYLGLLTMSLREGAKRERGSMPNLQFKYGSIDVGRYLTEMAPHLVEVAKSITDPQERDRYVAQSLAQLGSSLNGLSLSKRSTEFVKTLSKTAKELGRLSSPVTRQALAAKFFENLSVNGQQPINDMFAKAIIEDVALQLPASKTRELVGLFWKSDKMKDEEIYRFVLSLSVHPDVFNKIATHAPDTPKTTLEKTILFALSRSITIGPDGHLVRLKSKYDRVIPRVEGNEVKGSVDSVMQFFEEEVDPLFPERELSKLLFGSDKASDVFPHILARTSNLKFKDEDRLLLYSRAMAAGLISPEVLPDLISRLRLLSMTNGTTSSEVTDNLSLAAGVHSVRLATGRSVVRSSSGEKERYSPPAGFSDWPSKEKLDFLKQHGVPIAKTIDQSLRQYLSGSMLRYEPLKSPYEPLEPQQFW